MKKASIIATVALLIGVSSVQATEDFCAVVLKTLDGFLALRDGPGTQFRMKAKLHQGDLLTANTRGCTFDGKFCDDGNKRKWTYIFSVPRLDGPPETAKHFTEGWVYDKYIQGFGCPEDHEAEGLQ
jgi:hypothetical protein